MAHNDFELVCLLQLTLGGNFASEMFTYRCAEMVGTAGISCMLLVLVVNTLRLAQVTNTVASIPGLSPNLSFRDIRHHSLDSDCSVVFDSKQMQS